MKTLEYRVGQTGYEVDVLDGGKVIESYSAGNHRGDSQVYVPVDSPCAVSLARLREFALSTAKEMAGEHGVDESNVQEGDELDM